MAVAQLAGMSLSKLFWGLLLGMLSWKGANIGGDFVQRKLFGGTPEEKLLEAQLREAQRQKGEETKANKQIVREAKESDLLQQLMELSGRRGSAKLVGQQTALQMLEQSIGERGQMGALSTGTPETGGPTVAGDLLQRYDLDRTVTSADLGLPL